MNQIQPHSLWVGSTGNCHDWRHLYELGIRAVVQLAYEEPLPSLPHDFIVCRFPLVDGEDNSADLLTLAVGTLTRLLEQKCACLVCCQAGQSRSPAVAAAALAKLTRQPFSVCLAFVAEHHPSDVHTGLLAQLAALCEAM